MMMTMLLTMLVIHDGDDYSDGDDDGGDDDDDYVKVFMLTYCRSTTMARQATMLNILGPCWTNIW
jgi:hypothetical protein